ncbi:MAG TPA: RsmE family RNA methyltransferase [Bacilli bacterium]|nr:RsmE family RNA methyltransferase [Bacilli bacterium]
MQRYFVQDIKNNQEIAFTREDEFHILRVMRFKVHQRLEVVFENKLFLGEIINVNPLKAIVREPLFENSENESDVTILFALAKAEKPDLVIQKCTELGIKRVILFASEHSVVKIDASRIENKRNRYMTIAKEASEQCHRLAIPEIIGPMSLKEALSYDRSKHRFVCDTTQAEDGKIWSIKAAQASVEARDSIAVAIGPEGGFSPSEIALFHQMKFASLSLGPRILRSETAAITAAALFSILNY